MTRITTSVATVAIIIVNWKKYDITSTCIESILNSTNSNFKIILVDNESDNKKVKKFKYRNEIEKTLNPIQGINLNYISSEKNSLTLNVSNLQRLPIEIIGFQENQKLLPKG